MLLLAIEFRVVASIQLSSYIARIRHHSGRTERAQVDPPSCRQLQGRSQTSSLENSQLR